MPTLASPPAVDAQLTFTRVEDVCTEPGQRGVRRARTLEPDAMMDPNAYDQHTCRVFDCCAPGHERAARAMDRVVRKSLEMRAVGWYSRA